MTTTVAELQVVVDGDGDGAKRTLAGLNSDVEGAERSVRKMGRAMGKGAAVGGAALLGLGAVATTAATGGIGFAIKQGSDLNETLNVTGEVFPQLESAITGAAQEASKLGVVKTQFLEGANAFGLLAQGAGLAEKEAADLAIGFANLAGDASSFYNVPVEQALQDIRSGLSGEAEPLKKYGILLNEAAVKAKAMELGLADANGEIDTAAKTAARAALITEGFSKASGDLARTQDSVANRTRSLQGQLQNFAADAGQALLPVAQEFLGTLSNLLTEVGPVLTEAMSSIAPVLGQLGTTVGKALGALIPALTPLVEVLGTVIAALGDALTPVIEGLAPIIGELAMSLGDVLLALVPLIPPLGDVLLAFAPMLPVLADLIAALVEGLVPILVPLAEHMATMAQVAMAVMMPALESVAAFVGGPLVSALQAIAKPIEAVIGWFRQLYMKVVGGSYVPDLVNGVMRWIGRMVTAVPRLIATMVTRFARAVWGGVQRVIGFYRQLPGRVLSILKSFGKRLFSAGRDLLSGFIRGIKSKAKAVKDTVTRTVSSAVTSVRRLLRLGSPSRLFAQFGRWTGDGLRIGIQQRQQDVAKAARGLAGAVQSAYKPPSLSAPGVGAPQGAAARTRRLSASPGGEQADARPVFQFAEGAIVIQYPPEVPPEQAFVRQMRGLAYRSGPSMAGAR